MKRIVVIVILGMLMFLPAVDAVFRYDEGEFPLYESSSCYVYTIEITNPIDLGGEIEILDIGWIDFWILPLSEYESSEPPYSDTRFVLTVARDDGMQSWNYSISGIETEWKFVYWKGSSNPAQMRVKWKMWNWDYYPITDTTTTDINNTTTTTTDITSTNTNTSDITDLIGDPYVIIMLGIISMSLVAGYMVLRKKKPAW